LFFLLGLNVTFLSSWEVLVLLLIINSEVFLVTAEEVFYYFNVIDSELVCESPTISLLSVLSGVE
jgi:hypothetical protein